MDKIGSTTRFSATTQRKYTVQGQYTDTGFTTGQFDVYFSTPAVWYLHDDIGIQTERRENIRLEKP